MRETQVWSLGQWDILEKGMATHSSILAWKIPWTEEPDGLQSVELPRVGYWATNIHSSVLAWRIPGTGEPGGLLSMGLHRVGHDWCDLAAVAAAERLTHTNLIYWSEFNIGSIWGLKEQITTTTNNALVYPKLQLQSQRTGDSLGTWHSKQWRAYMTCFCC